MTLAHDALKLERQVRDTSLAETHLDIFLEDVLAKKPDTAAELLSAIADTQGAWNFSPLTGLLLTDALLYQNFNCYTNTLLHLAAAEKIGLHMTAVRAPDHVYVRIHQGLRPGGVKFSRAPSFAWETTNGTFLDERKYQAEITPNAIAQGTYLADLDKNGEQAMIRIPLGLELRKMRRFAEAETRFTEAIALDPQSLTALVNRGVVRLDQNKPIPAIDDFNAALKLDPRDEKGYNGRAKAYKMLNEESA